MLLRSLQSRLLSVPVTDIPCRIHSRSQLVQSVLLHWASSCVKKFSAIQRPGRVTMEIYRASASRLKSLKTPLKRLRDLVEDTQLTDVEIANDINEKELGLEHQVQRLEKKLKLIKPVFSDRASDKFRNKLKKVAYPVVTRDALRDIKSDLDSMQSTIQMTLAM